MLSFEKRDFPFYNEIPKMSKIGWLVLLVSVPVALFSFRYVCFYTNEFAGSIVFLLIMLIPLLYFSDWDYSLFFRPIFWMQAAWPAPEAVMLTLFL